MIRSISLKVSLLICHALIIMLEGHGLIPLGFLQFYYFFSFSNWAVLVSDDLFEKFMFLGSLQGVAAYLLVLVSFSRMSPSRERWVLVLAISLLWGSLCVWTYAAMQKTYTFIPVPLMLPLAYCTIRMMYGKNIQRALARLRKEL
jgi:hypothetical protein